MAMAMVIGNGSQEREALEKELAEKIANLTQGPATVTGLDSRVVVAGGGNEKVVWIQVHSLNDFKDPAAQKALAEAILASRGPFAVILQFNDMSACWAKMADGGISQF